MFRIRGHGRGCDCDHCYAVSHPPPPLTCPCCGVSEAEEDCHDLVNDTWCKDCLAAECGEQSAGAPCRKAGGKPGRPTIVREVDSFPRKALTSHDH
jgi:hypothetical protein